MPLVRRIQNFNSRVIRRQSTAIPGGVRQINVSGSQDKNGKWIWDLIKKWTGWLIDLGAEFLKKINFKAILDWCYKGTNFILNFNFGAGDAQLKAKVDAIEHALSVRTWGLAGRTLGTFLAGSIGIGGAFLFNEALGWHILSTAGKEILSEYTAYVAVYLRQFFTLKAEIWLINKFIKARRSNKFLQPENYRQFGRFISSFFGDAGQKYIENSYKDGVNQAPWSFTGETQKLISYADDKTQDKAEAFLEEFGDAFWDTGYAIANELDNYFYKESVLDTARRDRIVVLQPNREIREERIILQGNDAQLRSAITQTLAIDQLLNNRDMGFEFTSPHDEIPITESNGIELKLILYNYEKPPYWTKERRKKLVKSEIYIPNCDKTKISYERIKTLFGNSSICFNKGNVIATADLSNGRRLKVYVSNEQEGETVLEKLVSLTDLKIIYPINLNIRKGSRLGNKEGKERSITPMYMSYCIITNWHKLTKYEEFKKDNIGIDVSDKDPKKKIKKIEMYYEDKPSWVDEYFREVLSNSIN